MHIKETNKKNPLGQGLSALLGYSDDNATSHSNSDLEYLDVNRIVAGKNQPRKIFLDSEMESLSNSIREKGILQPIIVRRREDGFEIIAGERRWRAAKSLGMTSIPTIIMDVSDVEAHEISIVENIQRHDLNPIEEAEGYNVLIDNYKYTQEKIAIVVGKSRSHIANSLRLLNLNKNVKDKISSGDISPGHARAILISDDQESLLQKILAHNLSVRESEKLAKSKYSKKQRTYFQDDSLHQQASELSSRVSEQLGLPVKISLRKDGGHISITFFSYEQMDQLFEKLRGN